MGRMLAFDFETTGLTLHPDAELKRQPKIIELGAVLLSTTTGEIEEEASVLINPGEPLDPVITKITGLTDEALADAPPFLAVLPQLRRLFASAEVCVAHNLPFDRQVLRGELARHGITAFQWPARELCTLALYTHVWGRPPKLTELYAHVMGRELAQTHRALDDVLAMVEIIREAKLWSL